MKNDADSINNKFGCILAELRTDNQMTQKEFAKILNISTSALAHYEQGISMPATGVLLKISEYFCVPVDYLLGKCSCKVEYEKLSDIFYDNMTYGDLINQLLDVGYKDKQYIYYILNLIKEAKRK